MALAPGTRFGPYEITAPIGAGGMGEVYGARDTRLDRTVALKISKGEFSERFEREARVIASLNHPHICTLYDVGPDYLVMELVEGESLDARLERGPLPLDQALRYGAQIAGALAAAHAKGIVHRDLKPGNVMLAKSGVKVLDFGLAKSDDDATMTASNLVLGTPAYMSPEQRLGRVCNPQTDIFALGLVLYEMATGQRVPLGAVGSPGGLQEPFAHIVDRCLAADPDQRWQSARDVQLELEWAAAYRPPALPVAKRERILAWGIAAAVAIAAIAAIAAMRTAAPPAPRRVQFSLPFERIQAYGDLPRLAPGGNAVVYSFRDAAGARQLWLRSLDSDAAKPIPGTDEGLYPFWSADGKRIGFYAQRKLKTIAVDGTNPVTVSSLPAFDGTAAWSATGEIVYAPGNRAPLFAIPESGGAARQLTKLDASRTENSHRGVSFFPDGRRFLFVARCGDRANNALYVGSLAGGEARRVAPIQSNAAYVPAPHGNAGLLLFAREGTLYRQPFDGERLSGEAVRIMDVSYRAIGIQAYFDVSADGRVLLAFPPVSDSQVLKWFDRDGVPGDAVGAPGIFIQLRISPDGSRVLFNRPDENGGNRDLWVMELGRGLTSPLTVDPGNEFSALWAPDGRSILFASDRGGHRYGSTWEKDSFEPGAGETPVPWLPEWANPRDWSKDRKWLLFYNGEVHGDVWVAPTFGDRKPFRFFVSGFEDRGPKFSPDAKWIAYSSNESGRFEVYVRPFSGGPAEPGNKIRISTRGGHHPVWSRDGSELFFIGPDAKLYVASARTLAAASLVPAPRALFSVCPGNTPTGSATEAESFDVSPDGRKFLFACSVQAETRYLITLNWRD